MTFLKIKDTLYPATFRGRSHDSQWDNRDSIVISLEMTHEQAADTFVDNQPWSLVQQFDAYEDENGNVVTPDPEETDYSDYCVAGSITDNRDGTITAKMGKITAEEALAELMEVLA